MFKKLPVFLIYASLLCMVIATAARASTNDAPNGPGGAFALLDHVPTLCASETSVAMTPPIFLMTQDVSGFTYEIINTDDNPDVSGQLVAGAGGTFDVNYPGGSCEGALTSRLTLVFFDPATGATLAVTHGSGPNYTVPSGLAGSLCRVWLGIYCDGVLIDLNVWYVSVI